MSNPAIFTSVSFNPDRLPKPKPIISLRYNKVTSDDLKKLIEDIKHVVNYYSNKSLLEKRLVTLYYKGITPKTSRVSRLFCEKDHNSFDSMVGGKYERFYEGNSHQYRHVITHYISAELLEEALYLLTVAAKILDESFGGNFLKEYLDYNNPYLKEVSFDKKIISKTTFVSVIKDASELRKIDILFPDDTMINGNIIRFFQCFSNNNDLDFFLNKVGVVGKYTILDSNTAILTNEQIKQLRDIAPYVISMGVDFSTIEEEDIGTTQKPIIEEISPKVDNSLPVIGVFDTYFDKSSFFSEYVDVIDLLENKHKPIDEDFYHGTKVDSILVMGHKINGSKLNDNCGFFRVKHFIVGGYEYIDFEILYTKMEDIVKDNCASIKIWNLSLGDKRSVDPNNISLLGAKIDEISRKYNVLFVVSGTNIDSKIKDFIIGSPADSLNALVVNSIDFDGKVPDYARHGPVLTLLPKPDISYFGGTINKKLICYSPNPNDCYGYGTSFSAPYIARKCAYLVYVCKVPVQCAKAMIIDSAYGWGENCNNKPYLGYGTPDVDINNVIGSKKDEIKFVFFGNTKNQHTYISDFPLLLEKDNKFNYRVKITFCYFTYGTRNFGVDYADQDVSIKFGPTELKPYKRADDTFENHTFVKSITNENIGLSDVDYLGENTRIIGFGKWNNTNIMVQERKTKIKCQQNEKWGMMINHLERVGAISEEEWKDHLENHSINFGAVVTFKTLDGTDARYDDFYRLVDNNDNYVLRKFDLSIENEIDNQAEKEQLLE